MKKTQKHNHRVILWIMDSYVSFKTVLFIFYFLILIISQVINIFPSIAGETLTNFILANNSGLVLVVVYDRILNQFSKDRQAMKERSEKTKNYLQDNDFLPIVNLL
ncbi:hypothetical protein AZF37_04120 [endosymbiont 'TC1' of Trimyema compressum]|uniref:hypothetical protein n=1 Tax=endosymbiont 'TC1' of Trimyema compressum TaxID=243899 RepID=UPI0007F0FDAB|nr:hypothetical protein [endosymbiont 'TC1' of Trimyema compressum]AMP20464.1 hypothetical protein AZF37_04120 [endosymbiont 'TC1' of Trimyema compressum]